jgi:hypothetical protein
LCVFWPHWFDADDWYGQRWKFARKRQHTFEGARSAKCPKPISADLARAWRSMPSDPSNPTILALGAIARLATSWLPVPHAMSNSSAVPSADRSARNAASAGSGDFSRCGWLS